MREIEFRGYNYQYQKWFYGSLVTQNYAGDFILSNIKTIIVDDRLNQVVVDSETIGQYTGLTDKNGNKIFEGDILKEQRYQNGKPYGNQYKTVAWNDKTNGFNIRKGVTEWEVIGNIYDEEVE